ncbi:MAG TPA: hypothetical protein VJ508_17540 [Saprospiraceae bacterium]|nr:hypothetical protein [Saprospiraceae bacterium]
MKPLIIAALIIGGAITVVMSCKYDDVVIVQPAHISFSQDIIPIFNASCNTSGCHNGAGPVPNLTASAAYGSLWEASLIDTLQPTNSQLYQWVSGQKGLPMPPEGVNDQYVARILQWIDEGAQNN